MIYQWKAAARCKADPQKAGEICEQLSATGGLTAARLVEVSRPEDAPLHDEFEWDDAKAANAYREDQARYIIRCLCVAPETTEKEPVRAFFKLDAPTYTDITTICRNEDSLTALKLKALEELRAFERKFSCIRELQPIFDAIKNLENIAKPLDK